MKFLGSLNRVSKAEQERLTEKISNWAVLADGLADLTEDDLKKLMLIELAGKGRLQILQRLKSRFNKLRNERENKELLGYGA